MLGLRNYKADVPQYFSDLAESQGFSCLSIADAIHGTAQGQIYEEWLSQGNHGTMDFLKQHAKAKYHPEEILPGVQSIIFFALPYLQNKPYDHDGKIARYAWGRDYHKTFKKRLLHIVHQLHEDHPGGVFKRFADATPLDERFYLEQSGGAYFARNHMAIHAKYGSWFLIGEILSTVHFPPSRKEERSHGACPLSCRLCSKHCPTGALRPDGSMDASRCISYLTIEHKQGIDPELRPKVGDWVFGCDICQSVCPLNVQSLPTEDEDMLGWRAGNSVDLAEILDMQEREEFVERFQGSPLMRAGLEMLQRNAMIVAANTNNRELIPKIQKFLNSHSPILKEQAEWTLGYFRSGKSR
jgi:epoxyqueuosine reductase